MSKKAKTKAVSVPDKRKQMLKLYADYVLETGGTPVHADLHDIGVNWAEVYHQFKTMDGYRKAALIAHPKAFKDIIDPCLFSPKVFAELQDDIKGFKRFFITTAVTGCNVHEGFYKTANSYCSKRDAVLLITPSSDTAAESEKGFYLDPILKDNHIVFDDLGLNANCFISSVKLSAKHIDPITGLGRIGQRNGSFIFASPKQRLKMVATSSNQLPHALMTTGAITKPSYDSERYMSHRTAYIADHDHVIGGIIVEIQDNKTFHFRQVQAAADGSFVDLGIMYYPNGTTKSYAPEALVLGDWHSGETDPVARRVFLDGKDSVTNVLKPKILIVHDGFNGRSISHHEEKDRVRRAQLAGLNQICLEDEIRQYGKDIDDFTAKYEKVKIVCSNHDEFLHRYLKSGRFIEDPQNAKLASLLFHHMCDGHNPLQYALEKIIGLKHPEKIEWFNRSSEFKIAGCELSAHGDLGSNGAKGSLVQMEHAYGNYAGGHTHTPEILRQCWTVGTTSILNPNYVRGASSWMHCSMPIYGNGMRQLIMAIGENWRTK
jgi:hypothetical protein